MDVISSDRKTVGKVDHFEGAEKIKSRVRGRVERVLDAAKAQGLSAIAATPTADPRPSCGYGLRRRACVYQ